MPLVLIAMAVTIGVPAVGNSNTVTPIITPQVQDRCLAVAGPLRGYGAEFQCLRLRGGTWKNEMQRCASEDALEKVLRLTHMQ